MPPKAEMLGLAFEAAGIIDATEDSMKVSTMRQFDRWVGGPACLVLTAFRKCGVLWHQLRKTQPTKVQRILFVKLAEQGATVLAHRAITRAVQMVGQQNVYFLVFEENRFILDLMGLIPEQNVIPIPADNFRSLLSGTILALRRLRKLHIDAAIDFEFFARSSAVLTYLSGAKVRVGLHSFAGEAAYRGDLMTHRLSYNPHIHISQMFQVMVEALKTPAKELPALSIDTPPAPSLEQAFIPTTQEVEEFKTVVESQAHTSDYSPLVLLNANASDLLPVRRWPAGRYVELARRLIERSPEVHVAFTGAADEAKHAEKLVEDVGSDRCFSLTGKTTLRQLMVLYCLADALVTNDSGPAHFATLTPIQVITLFGPETPELFGANSPRAHIIWKGIPCSPCVNAYNNRTSACRNNVCMQRITVDEVFDLLCRLCKL